MDVMQLNSARKFVGEAGHTLDLSRVLASRGHRVTLCLREGYDTIARAREAGLDPVGFRMNSRWWPPDDWTDIRLLRSLIRCRNIRMIHAHRGKDHWLAVLAARAFGGSVKVVRTRHVVMPPAVNFANRWLARKTARMICVSRAVLHRCEESGMYEPEKLRLIHGGVDVDRFSPRGRRDAVRSMLGLPPDAPVAVHVARFAAVKDHATLLSAWREVVAALPGARLLLVGDGKMRPEMERRAADFGLGRTVVFLGARGDVPDILEASDAGVLCSSGSEGFSRAVAEYMAMGLPVATTCVGAVPDLVNDGREGLIVPPRDPAAMAGAIRKLLSDAASARRMGEAAKSRAVSEFDWKRIARLVEDLYRETLDEEAGG